jgi:HlyD family secretion protein
MQGKWMLFGGIAVFLAAGAGAIAWWRGSQPTAPATAKSAVTQPAAISGNEIRLSGKIQPQELVPVPAPIEGIIDEMFVDAGGEVYEGQLIARIRNGKLDSMLESATAEVEKLKTRITTLEGSIIAGRLEASRAGAEAARIHSEFERLDRAFQRQQMLLREGATPRLIYEKAEREYKQSKADHDSAAEVAKSADDRVAALNRDLDAAKKLLEGRNEELENAKEEAGQGEVKSPADGLVISRKGSPGEQVTAGVEDFFVLATNLTALQVVLDPEPGVLPRIKPGQIAGVRIAESGDEIPGFVREIKGTQVLVDFVVAEANVKPGLTAQVRISLAESVSPAAPSSPPQGAPVPAATMKR